MMLLLLLLTTMARKMMEANVELSFTTDEHRACLISLFVVAKTHLRLVSVTTSTTTPDRIYQTDSRTFSPYYRYLIGRSLRIWPPPTYSSAINLLGFRSSNSEDYEAQLSLYTAGVEALR